MPPVHHACGLREELVVPEANRAAEQLRRRHQECRIPPQGGQDTPRTQRMEANPVWVRGFVRVILLEQVAPRMSRIHQLVQFSAQDFYLFIGERSEEHTSELQSLTNLVCRLLLEKKKNQ